MYKTLAVSFLAIFCFSTSEARYYDNRPLICIGCKSVHPYGHCIKKPYICMAKKKESCYNRMVSKDGEVLFVDQGCISNCIHVQRDKGYKNLTSCCRSGNFCNDYNLWPNDLPPEPTPGLI